MNSESSPAPPSSGCPFGGKVYLRSLEPEDYLAINAWRRDDEIYRLTTGNRSFISAEVDRQWVLDKLQPNDRELYLGVCLAAAGTLIGYISLSAIDYRNSRAEWSGLVIGSPEHRGHGYASESLYLLLTYAFDELGLYRIAGSWLAENEISIFVARMMGFKTEGKLREHVFKFGHRHDVLIMSILRPEFEAVKSRLCEQPCCGTHSALEHKSVLSESADGSYSD